jgi:arylsulfatase A-like enzyme
LLLAVIAVTAIPSGSATRAHGATPRPNVLIIITDDQRGGLNVMPDTRKWFGQGGTGFTNAYATTPQCCPSRSSIFTGRYAHNHGVLTNGSTANLDHGTTVQYHLNQGGYATAIFGKFLNGWPLANAPPNFDTWSIFNSPYPSYVGREWNVDGVVQKIDRYPTRYIADRAISFVRNAAQPWFMVLAPPNPHEPYTAERVYAQADVGRWAGNPAVFESDRSDKPPYVRNAAYSFADGNDVRTRQLRSLMSVDDMVDRIFVTLGNVGVRRNTLAFFISDNGFLWAEHGLKPQKAVPYTPAIQVPFFARWPGHLPGGATDSRLVANIDIAPTILSATLGTAPPAIDGRSLLSNHTRDRLLLEAWRSNNAEIPPWASTLTRGGQYVEYYGPGNETVFREFYDLTADPWQLENLGQPPPGWTERLTSDRICAGAGCP